MTAAAAVHANDTLHSRVLPASFSVAQTSNGYRTLTNAVARKRISFRKQQQQQLNANRAVDASVVSFDFVCCFVLRGLATVASGRLLAACHRRVCELQTTACACNIIVENKQIPARLAERASEHGGQQSR